DIFLGLSGARGLKRGVVKESVKQPLLLAMAHPEPEIGRDLAKAARRAAVVASAGAYFHKQVNNVLCFPFIFRSALDVGATTINEAMKLAAVEAIAALAREAAAEGAARAYGGEAPLFGSGSLIPNPFD